jgi:YegS/Rv2252/BmrU family lipid kinase
VGDLQGKTVVIVNPASGAGRSGARWNDRRAILETVLPEFVERRTDRRGHASVLAREALEAGAVRLVSVGGDGTWHEVVQGFMSAPEERRRDAVLGLLPTGSGCDFARHFGIPLEFEDAALRLEADTLRRLDVVRAEVAVEDGTTRTLFLTNMAAFGLAGEVARVVEESGKSAGGTLSYLLATLGAVLRSAPSDFEVRLDGRRLDGPFHTVLLANTSSTGGGMKIAPDADAEDGRFEVVTVGAMSKLSMLLKLRKVYSGSHVGEPGLEYLKGECLEAKPPASGGPFPLNLDGEAYGRLPATFTIERGVLPVLV